MPRPTRSLLRRPHLTWRLTHPCAAYTDLEVWDTAELTQLESQMLEMEKSLSALRAKAVAEKDRVEAKLRRRGRGSKDRKKKKKLSDRDKDKNKDKDKDKKDDAKND